jgi:hypothetical protein
VLFCGVSQTLNYAFCNLKLFSFGLDMKKFLICSHFSPLDMLAL